MEFMFGLFAGYLLNYTALVLFVLVGIIFESTECHASAVFMGITAAVIAYFMFQIPLQYLLYGFIAYLLTGIVWSIWRYKRYVDNRMALCSGRSEEFTKNMLSSVHPRFMTGRFVTWILIWPFSMFSNVMRDFISLLGTLVSKWFKGAYMGIYNSAVTRATLVTEETNNH